MATVTGTKHYTNAKVTSARYPGRTVTTYSNVAGGVFQPGSGFEYAEPVIADIPNSTDCIRYTNDLQSQSFNRNNCGSGTGSSVVYSIPAGTYISTISQADADNMALANIAANGQNYANSHGICTYASVAKSGTYSRNNCGTDMEGTLATYTVVAGAYTSTVSQVDADAQAQADVDANGQAYANANASCLPAAVINNNLTEQGAPNPYIDVNSQVTVDGADVSDLYTNGTETVQARPGAALEFTGYTVVTSGATDPLLYLVVNKNGIQVFSGNTPVINGNFVKYTTIAESGATYDMYVYSTNVASFSSVRQSQVFTKNNCSPGLSGTSVEYVVAAGAYTSSVSQADADAQASADVAANGQANANSLGTCLTTSDIATLLVDYDGDTDADLCFFCSTPGTDELDQIVASSANGGPIQLPNDGRDPAGCFVLSSDKLSGPPTRRFAANLAYFIVKYPGINIHTFDMVGRSSSNMVINGSYAKRNASQGHLILGTYSDGISKIPGVSGATLADIVNYTSHVIAGANGTVGTGVGATILRLEFNVSANTITATTY